MCVYKNTTIVYFSESESTTVSVKVYWENYLSDASWNFKWGMKGGDKQAELIFTEVKDKVVPRLSFWV